MIPLRRLNEAGVSAFREYLAVLRIAPSANPPTQMLTDPAFSEEIQPEVLISEQAFATRLQFAQWLDSSVANSGNPIPRSEPGFWAWMSLLLFDQVCPKNSSGSRQPGADARHIPDRGNFRRRYRHLLANPFDVYQMHRDDPSRAAVVLLGRLDVPGELTEQFTSRFELVSCAGSMALATRLYVDARSGARKRGASGGSARRFGKLMNQYSRTWDLPEVDAEAFAARLPPEFDRFK